MLMNDFYTVQDLQYQDNRMTCRISYDEQHPVFKGHFPGQPVVPGVCTLQTIKELLETMLQRKLVLQQAAQVKYLRLLTPDRKPSVLVEVQEQAGQWQANASLQDEGTDVFKLSGAVYVPAP